MIDTPAGAGRAERMLRRGLGVMNVAGALLIVALLVLVNSDAFGRTFFGSPVLGAIELVELSLIAIVFLQLGDAIRAGRLTRSDGLLLIVEAHRPRIAAAMHAVFDLLAAIFMILILAGAVPSLLDAYSHNEFKGTAGVFTAPEWPVRLIVVLGAIAATLAFSTLAWRAARRTRGR